MRTTPDPREAQAALGLVLALLLLAAVSVWDQREDREDRAHHESLAPLAPLIPAPSTSSPIPREGPR